MIGTFQLGTLLAMCADFSIGVLVYLTNARRTVNRLFFVLSIVLVFWLLCQFRGTGAPDMEALSFWVRQACGASVVVPLLASMLRIAVEQPEAKLRGILRASALWLLCAAATAWICHCPAFLSSVDMPSPSNVLGMPHYGPLFPVFVAYWVFSALALMRIFWRGISRAVGVSRIELQFMALASILGIVPGILLILVIPMFMGNMRTAVFSPFSVVIWYSTIAYGIATHRIMGVAEFLRRLITYLLVAVFLTLVYMGVFHLTWVLADAWGARINLDDLSHVAAGVAIALMLAPTNTFLQQQADYLFASGRKGLADLLRRGRRLTQSLVTLDDLLCAFALLLRDTLSIEDVRIYIRADGHYALQHRQGDKAQPMGFSADAPLVRLLRHAEGPLVRDILRRQRTQTAIEHALREAQAEAVVVLRAKEDVDGFVLLGRRRGGLAYGLHESDALGLLGDQLGTAVENAMLYTRLQDARHHDEVLLDHLVTGVVACDTAGRLTVCNREALRILQVPDGEAVLGRPADAILPEPLGPALRQSLEQGQRVRDADAVLRWRTAAEMPVRYGTAVFSGHADTVMGALLVLQDVSTLRRLEEQVRRNDRLASLGTLAAGMAHEIKNPLVSLKTFAQLLPDRYDDPEFRTTFGPLLVDEVSRIDQLVGQLLDFARPVKPSLAPVSLHAILDASLQLVAQQIKTHGLSLRRALEAPAEHVRGDERLLRQVFVNLLLNAVEAMKPGGTLTVGTRAAARPATAWREGQLTDAWVEAWVGDTGSGIAPADRTRIFDPFFTTKPSGTGLGLSVVHGIVWDHLGCIDVESDPGHGACFRVTLPLPSRSTM